jgi:hypothetical protein
MQWHQVYSERRGKERAMSPEAQPVMDRVLDVIDGQLSARDLTDIAYSLMCLAISELEPERQAAIQALLSREIERGVAGFTALKTESSEGRRLN